MGYGAFDGGGSVKWHVQHGNGDFAAATHPTKGDGRDQDPANPGTNFKVWIFDSTSPGWQMVADFPLDNHSKVKVLWGRHYNTPPTDDPAD